MIIINPMALRTITKAREGNVETVKENMFCGRIENPDSVDDYSGSDGNGCWVRDFILGIEERIRDTFDMPLFKFRYEDCINSENLVTSIRDPVLRRTIAKFINENYRDWVLRFVNVPSYESAESIVGDSICDACDIQADCSEDCDTFSEAIDDYVYNHTDVNIPALFDIWDSFMERESCTFITLNLPSLLPPPCSRVNLDYIPIRSLIERINKSQRPINDTATSLLFHVMTLH